jgi:cellulose synthase/poly-beta-1,6-N-acetylglucosamine synthase-like glycosyltransferase
VALARTLLRPRGAGGEAAITTPSAYERALRSQLGPAVAEAAAGTRPRRVSARDGAGAKQAFALIAFLALCLATLAPPGAVGDVATAALSLLFLAAMTVRLAALAQSFEPPREAPAPPLAERDLPRYSVVVALYREAGVARDLVAALSRLDYPRARLEVKFVLEEDDAETRATFAALDLPPGFSVVVAPAGAPRTKPRALNVALAAATGDLVVVYDAEDRPEPDQLRKAAARFAVAPARVACLQARLAVDNGEDSWIARLFSIEYAGLFDALDPGYCALDLPLPLGGTSNHFRIGALRAAAGWDAWNVTEDADLGLRLARLGLRVETLDSTTWEEAPITVSAWLGQRGRWLKGWMQTLVVHTRAPARAMAEFGPWRALCAWATIGGALASALFLPLFLARIALDAWAGDWLRADTPLAFLASTLSLTVLALGPLAAFGAPAVGLWRRGWRRHAVWLALFPVYYLLASLAAWRALVEACAAPHRWVKTQHGVSRSRRAMPN